MGSYKKSSDTSTKQNNHRSRPISFMNCLRRVSMSCSNSSLVGVGAALFVASVGVPRIWSLTASTSRVISVPFSTSGDVKKSKIYTKTGDSGFSSLYNGERRAKADDIFHTLGNQDELNATIGIAIEYCLLSNNGLQDKLIEIQSRLFDLGAAVATPRQSSPEMKLQYTKFPTEHTQQIERWIDELDSTLPPLTNFVLPSGGLSATHINLARTVCRRAERSVVPLVAAGTVDAEVQRYLNRLSDFLFVAGRVAAAKEGRSETIWRKARNV